MLKEIKIMTYTSITPELSTLNYPYTVKHKTHGIGQLVYITVPTNGNSLYANIDFESGSSKVFALKTLIDFNLLEMPDDIKPILTEAQSIFFATYETAEQEKREAQRLAYEQKMQAEENARQEAKYEASKAKMIKEFETLAKTERPVSAVGEFYYSLGWLAKHVGVITAKLPDYLGSAFEKHFGTEAPKTLVDGRAKTIGGYAKQWSWEFVASVKKLKDTTVPAYLQTVTSEISKGIHNTSFIWDLVSNYGFKFGKTQDIDQIRATIPTEYITYFENGYAE
jgi:hypothetical protein